MSAPSGCSLNVTENCGEEEEGNRKYGVNEERRERKTIIKGRKKAEVDKAEKEVRGREGPRRTVTGRCGERMR